MDETTRRIAATIVYAITDGTDPPLFDDARIERDQATVLIRLRAGRTYAFTVAGVEEPALPAQAIGGVNMPRFVYVFDCYVRIEADSEEEARAELASLRGLIDAEPGATLVVFDAFGIEDGETGEEIREVA